MRKIGQIFRFLIPIITVPSVVSLIYTNHKERREKR